MKRAKIFNGIFWASAWIMLCILVCLEWSRQGCGVSSLIIGCAFYGACSTALWATVHDFIKRKSYDDYDSNSK